MADERTIRRGDMSLVIAACRARGAIWQDKRSQQRSIGLRARIAETNFPVAAPQKGSSGVNQEIVGGNCPNGGEGDIGADALCNASEIQSHSMPGQSAESRPPFNA